MKLGALPPDPQDFSGSPAWPVSVPTDGSQYSLPELCCQSSSSVRLTGTREDACELRRYSDTTWLQEIDCRPSSKGFSEMIGDHMEVSGYSTRSYVQQLLLSDRSLTVFPSLFPSFLELPIALGKDQLLPSQKLIQRGDIPDSAVKPVGVVALDELFN